MGNAEGTSERLWVEWYGRLIARAVGRPAEWGYGPYLFILVVWLATAVGFPAIQFLRAGTFPILRTPGQFVLLPAWLFVVFAIVRLRDQYLSVLEDIPDPVEDVAWPYSTHADRLVGGLGLPQLGGHVGGSRVVPTRLKVAGLAAGLGVHASWFVLDPSPMSLFVEVYGRPLALIYFLVVVPVVYVVLAVELVSLYVAINLLLPLRVIAENAVTYSDELRFGGLRDLGRLLRNSSGSFAVILAFFVIFEWVGPQTDPLDPFSRILLFSGIAFGLVSFLGPTYVLHKFMSGMKEEKLRQIKDNITTKGPDDASFPDADPPDEMADFIEYNHEFINLNRVENMREWPVDFALVLEFLFVLVLPYIAHLSSIFLFEELLH